MSEWVSDPWVSAWLIDWLMNKLYYRMLQRFLKTLTKLYYQMNGIRNIFRTNSTEIHTISMYIVIKNQFWKLYTVVYVFLFEPNKCLNSLVVVHECFSLSINTAILVGHRISCKIVAIYTLKLYSTCLNSYEWHMYINLYKKR